MLDMVTHIFYFPAKKQMKRNNKVYFKMTYGDGRHPHVTLQQINLWRSITVKYLAFLALKGHGKINII